MPHAIGACHPSLRVHVIDTGAQGRLTPEQLIAAGGVPLEAVSVYLCGPHVMLQRFQADLRRAGVPRAQIHGEYFNWR